MPANKSKELSPGLKINKLTIIRLHHKDKRWRRHYLCRCDCGNEKVIQGSLIISGNTKSCGCLLAESMKKKRLPNNRGVINQIILSYKRHAKRRGLIWELNFDDVFGIINKPCYYCGIYNSNKKITKNCREGFQYNSIDRVDSNKGYVINNVVPCCERCNKAKMAMSKNDFLEWIQRVYNYSIKTQ